MKYVIPLALAATISVALAGLAVDPVPISSVAGFGARSGSIPRACSTPETKNFPFCDTKLSNDERIKDLISRLSLDEKRLMLTARESPKGDVPRLGVPEYDWGANCLHGVQSRCGTRCPTSFPSPNAFGAAFDADAVYRMASIIGTELRALWLEGVGENHDNNLPHLGLDCWSPNININRDPRWGRNQEVSSEDPFLTATYGVAHTRGLQEGKDKRYLQAVVTLKHYAAYSLENIVGTNITRHNFNAVVNKHDLADTYFPAWKASVRDANAKGVMCSYNALNGVPTCASTFLRDVLRKEWGFSGYVTSDTGAVEDLYTQHFYSKTPEDALRAALVDGQTDVCSGNVYAEHMLNATKMGYVKESDVDVAIYNTLKMRFELGLFDPIDDQPYWHVPPTAVNTAESQAFNLEMTKKSMVLLENNNVLPFSSTSDEKIAVIGPHAENQQVLVGNYLGQICPKHYNDFSCITSLADGIKNVAGSSRVSVAKGCDVNTKDTSGFAAAIALAKEASKVVLTIGLDQSVEGESNDRQTIALPGVQQDLIEAILKLNKPTVIVIISGGGVGIDAIKAAAASAPVAIVQAWYPGFRGADAVAATLFGKNEFLGGKLPVTMYKQDIIKELDFKSMDFRASPGRSYRYYSGDVLWPFGYGLSLTSFKLTASEDDTKFNLSNDDLSSSHTIRVTVTNTGSTSGDEVVQAYFTPPKHAQRCGGGVACLKQQLFFFHRVHLAPGQSTEVDVVVPVTALQTVTDAGDIVSLSGDYGVLLTNGAGQTVECTATVQGQASRTIERFPDYQ